MRGVNDEMFPAPGTWAGENSRVDRPVAFARGAAPKAGGKASKGGIVSDVIGAIAGTGGCGNGQVGGKKGFQPGNKCHQGRNPHVAAAQKAHTSANSVTHKHIRAGTLNTPAGRAAVRTAAKAARTLREARETHKAEQKVRYSENAKARRTAAKATAAKPESQATTQLQAAHAAANPVKAAAKAKAEAPPKTPAKPAAPKVDAKAEVAKASKQADDTKAKVGAKHLEDLKAGAASGKHDGDAILKHVDKLARGHTKDELFAAAKAAGIEHGATTKKALVDHLKGHIYDHGKAAQAKAEAPKPAPRAEPTKAPDAKPGHREDPGYHHEYVSGRDAAPHDRAHDAQVQARFRANRTPGPEIGPSRVPKTPEGDRKIAATIKDAIAHPEKHGLSTRDDLVPIHAIRDHVEKTLGDVGAARFDKVFKAERADGGIEAIAISDNRNMNQRQLDRSIPGLNENIAYAVKPDAHQDYSHGPKKASTSGPAAPHAFREALAKVHQGKIDDRQTTPSEVARKSGMPAEQVEATVRELGRKGAVSFDYATPQQIANAKGFHTFPTDHEGRPYVGFRVDRPRKFEEATR